MARLASASLGVIVSIENAGLETTRTNPACVIGQVAHPARACRANQRCDLANASCSGQLNATSTLTSSSTTIINLLSPTSYHDQSWLAPTEEGTRRQRTRR